MHLFNRKPTPNNTQPITQQTQPAVVPQASPLPTHDNTQYQVSLSLSAPMKQALERYCKAHNYTQSTLLRQALADRIGYDLRSDTLQQVARNAYNVREQQATSCTHTNTTSRTRMPTPRNDREHKILQALRGKERDSILQQLEEILK